MKGDYGDRVFLRDPQREYEEAVGPKFEGLERLRPEEKRGVALLECGAGKTLLSQNAQNRFYRETGNDAGLYISPRINLGEQTEESWNQEWRPNYAEPKIGTYRFVNGAIDPRIALKGKCRNWAITTATFVSQFDTWMAFMTKFGPYLSVDEAQFFGNARPGEEDVEGKEATRAGALLKQILPHAGFTTFMTATPQRVDRSLIAGIEDLYEVVETGPDYKEYLLQYTVRSTYGDGLSQRGANDEPDPYLIPFEAQLRNGWGKRTETSTEEEMVEEFELYLNKKGSLAAIYLDPGYWHPLVDLYCELLREQRKIDPRQRGVFYGFNQDQCVEIDEYIRRRFRDLPSTRAISREKDALKELRDFRLPEVELATMATVRMMHIGYNNPWLSVVGTLTGYRHEPAVLQEILRPARRNYRLPYDPQLFYVVAAPYLQMKNVVDDLRYQQDQAFRIYDRHKPPGPPEHSWTTTFEGLAGKEIIGIDPNYDLTRESDVHIVDKLHKLDRHTMGRTQLFAGLLSSGLSLEEIAERRGISPEESSEGPAEEDNEPYRRQQAVAQELSANIASQGQRLAGHLKSIGIKCPFSRGDHANHDLWEISDTAALLRSIFGKKISWNKLDWDYELPLAKRWLDEVFEPHVFKMKAEYDNGGVQSSYLDWDHVKHERIMSQWDEVQTKLLSE